MQSASTNITTFPGKVGISNANPTHTLAIGSNVYVDDTGSNKLTVTGVISGDGLGISNIQTANVLGLTDNVTRITTLETDLDNNFVSGHDSFCRFGRQFVSDLDCF